MTTLATDTFTDTAGTLLPAHTADTGQSWTKSADSDPTGDINIITVGGLGSVASCSVTGVGARAVLNASAPTADYTVQAQIFNRSGSDDNYPSLFGRALAASGDGYQCYWRVTTSELFLRRNVAGVSVDLQSTTLSGSSPGPVIKMEMIGAVINIYVDGSLSFSYTDATPITAIGKPGIGFFTNTSHDAQLFHDLSVTYTATASGTGGMIHHLQSMGAY